MTDPWHFPRGALAAKTLLALTEGPSKALTLFAPRRRGKTEFLLKDVMPAAEKDGHIVVYISFWDPLEPLALLVGALEQAVSRSTVTGRVGAFASRLTPKIKLSASMPGTDAKGEVDLTQLPKAAEKALVAHVDTLLGKLERPRKKTILLLDEVQELARRKDDAGLVAALRTSLDVRSDGLRTIFTGSSRDGLKKMFGASKAPFFHFGTQIDLEPLGREFVEHIVRQTERVTKQKLDIDEAEKTFEELGKSPYHFRGLVEGFVLNPEIGFHEALSDYRSRIASKQGYDATWIAMKPLQRAVTRAIAEGHQKLYSEETLALIAQYAEREVGNSSVQRALEQMLADGVIDRWDNVWRISDDEFRIWLSASGER